MFSKIYRQEVTVTWTCARGVHYLSSEVWSSSSYRGNPVVRANLTWGQTELSRYHHTYLSGARVLVMEPRVLFADAVCSSLNFWTSRFLFWKVQLQLQIFSQLILLGADPHFSNRELFATAEGYKTVLGGTSTRSSLAAEQRLKEA